MPCRSDCSGKGGRQCAQAHDGKQRREHVRQGNAGDFEHVEADADDKRAADGCELRHGCGVKPALEAAREQCERPLIDKHGDGREQDPEPVGRGHRQRREAVDDGLGKDHGPIAPEPFVE